MSFMIEQPKKHLHPDSRHEALDNDESSTGLFLFVLEGMVYLIGAVFGGTALCMALRVYLGQTLPFLEHCNEVRALAPKRRLSNHTLWLFSSKLKW